MSALTNAVIPIFRIFDRAKAEEFYITYLGFTVDWVHGEDENLPTYQQVSRKGISLHLSEHHGDCCPGAKVRVQIDGLAEYHRQLADKNYRFMKPGLEKTPWSTTEMTVIDPFGNSLVFCEPSQKSQE